MGMMFGNVEAEFDIVIVGSGPAGLSAASRAQSRGNRYVLLEAEDHASDTIYKYQKGKHVMAEPGFLPLRSGMKFAKASVKASSASGTTRSRRRASASITRRKSPPSSAKGRTRRSPSPARTAVPTPPAP